MDILNENISKKIVIIAISIIVVLSLSISTTYSLIYNTKKLSKNTYTTGILDIQYTEGEKLDLNNYIPMNDESGIITDPYTITITNTGTLTYKFNLNILSTVENVENIIDAKYIRLQIDEKKPINLNELTNGTIYNNIILGPEESMEIKIKMWLNENTPNSEIGNIYSAKLVATGMAIQKNKNELHSTSTAYQSLVKLGLDKHAEQSYETGILETTVQTEYLYYFKGDIDYNYVLINDKYYRIILIDSKGNMKVIYSGNKAHNNREDNTKEKDTIISEVSFNNTSDKKIYNSYTYLDENIQEIDSHIKLNLEKWYEENISNTEIEKEIVDTIYCNDKRELEEENIKEEIIEQEFNNTIIYNSYNRILEEKEVNFTCIPSDSYTVSTEKGNGSLKYPVGLITADELLLIGDEYINNSIPFWTMTSAKYENNIAYNFSYNNKLTISKTEDKLGIRPVLTLKTTNLTGNGTKENPFKLNSVKDETKEEKIEQ